MNHSIDEFKKLNKLAKVRFLSIVCLAFVVFSPYAIAVHPTKMSIFGESTLVPLDSLATSIPTATPPVTHTIFLPLLMSGFPPPPNQLGSPYAPDCGDGVPQIWSNDSFNGPYCNCFDDHHGHVDIRPPVGCDTVSYDGEIVAPISGEIVPYDIDGDPTGGYSLKIPEGVYPVGLLDVLNFIKIPNPDLSKVHNLKFDFGHVEMYHEGHVEKGEKIGNLINLSYDSRKLADQITFIYDGDHGPIFPDEKEIMVSPTLFPGTNYSCVPNSPYDCVPEPWDYP